MIENFFENDISLASESSSAPLLTLKPAGSPIKFERSSTKLAEKDGLDTGIYKVADKTLNPILEGLWIQNDYLVFLTLNVDDDTINLEVFHYLDNALTRMHKCKLFSRNNADAWSVSFDAGRKFIACFLYSWTDSKNKQEQVAGYFVNLM